MHLTALLLPLLAGPGVLAAPAPSRQDSATSKPLSSLRSGVNGIGTFFQRLSRSVPWQRPAAYEVYGPSSAHNRRGSRRLINPKNKIHLDGAPGNATGSLNGTGTGIIGTGTIGTVTIPSTGTIITTFPTPSSPGGTGTLTTVLSNVTSTILTTAPIVTQPPSQTQSPSQNQTQPQTQNSTASATVTATPVPLSVSETVITIFSAAPSVITVIGTPESLTPTSTRTVWVTAEPAVLTQPTSTLTVFVTAPLATASPANPNLSTITVTAAAVTETSTSMPAVSGVPGAPTPAGTPAPGTGPIAGHTVTLRETQTLWSGVATSTSLVVIPDSVTDITSSGGATGAPAPATAGTSSSVVFLTAVSLFSLSSLAWSD